VVVPPAGQAADLRPVPRGAPARRLLLLGAGGAPGQDGGEGLVVMVEPPHQVEHPAQGGGGEAEGRCGQGGHLPPGAARVNHHLRARHVVRELRPATSHQQHPQLSAIPIYRVRPTGVLPPPHDEGGEGEVEEPGVGEQVQGGQVEGAKAAG